MQQEDTTLAAVIRERDVLKERLSVLEGGLRQALSRSGLFVIGHARSGTTILANALNDSDQVLILNEADLYSDPGTPDFRQRHNDRHRALRNQENKGNFCPRLFDEDESWDAYFMALTRTYRYVGAKMVINPYSDPAATEALLDFATRHFYSSHFIFTFRHPAAVFGSNRGLAEWNGGEGPQFKVVARSYLAVMRLFIHMLRTLPNVCCVFHDTVTEATFEQIGGRLGIDLRRSATYYDPGKTGTYPDTIPAGDDQNLVDHVVGFYRLLAAEAEAGFPLLQIDQNSATLDPRHLTPLGRLVQQIDFVLDSLAREG